MFCLGHGRQHSGSPRIGNGVQNRALRSAEAPSEKTFQYGSGSVASWPTSSQPWKPIYRQEGLGTCVVWRRSHIRADGMVVCSCLLLSRQERRRSSSQDAASSVSPVPEGLPNAWLSDWLAGWLVVALGKCVCTESSDGEAYQLGRDDDVQYLQFFGRNRWIKIKTIVGFPSRPVSIIYFSLHNRIPNDQRERESKRHEVWGP
jgi:hypothetical protein